MHNLGVYNVSRRVLYAISDTQQPMKTQPLDIQPASTANDFSFIVEQRAVKGAYIERVYTLGGNDMLDKLC